MFPTDDRDEVEPPSVPAGLVLAPLGRRVIGELIDELLIFLPAAVGAAIVGYRLGDDISDDAILVFNVALAATALAYKTLMIGGLARTVGKYVTGTRVVRLLDGGSPGWFSATQRALVPVVATGIPEVGWVLGPIVYGWAFFSPLRQGIHDRAAGTVVVLHRRPVA
ncbi:MAG: RDD family protein [Ilumatobacteraceae bacterium]